MGVQRSPSSTRHVHPTDSRWPPHAPVAFAAAADTATMTPPTSRRTVLTGALAGTVAAAAATIGAPTEAAAQSRNGDRPLPELATTPRGFTLAVVPDTQYLFDGEALHPEPLTTTLRWLAGQPEIAFIAHLGDVVQNGAAGEFAVAKGPFRMLTSRQRPFSVLAGNHDIDGSTDDRRGSSPWLDTFAPLTTRNKVSTFAAGYNTAYTFEGAGKTFLLLALDWRVSDDGLAWARSVLANHAGMPTIVTVHDAVDSIDGRGQLSEHGQYLWDGLIEEHPQIFLTVNGHFWPAARLTRQHSDGSPVEMHLANYQQTYFGGAAAVRLYRFDLDRGAVEVSTEVPYALEGGLNQLEREELQLIGPADRFSFPLPAALCAPDVRPARPAKEMVIRGTEAYWRFEGQGTLPVGTRVADASGHGNDLVATGAGTTPLTRVARSHPAQPSKSSLQLTGTKETSAYLLTVPQAPINRLSFEKGYTVEAFFQLPDPFTNDSAWTSMVSRWGSAKSAGRTKGDVDEPVNTLSVSGSGELQWVSYPANIDYSATNWGHELRKDRWWHVAIVNDGRHTTMFIDGCPSVRNPDTVSTGLLGADVNGGLPWSVGGYAWDGRLERTFIGTIGDVRICSRPLAPKEFLLG